MKELPDYYNYLKKIRAYVFIIAASLAAFSFDKSDFFS